ncbi:tumor necrosis factor ligand superfamily member 14-like [Haliotis cracherodii]|uniref:tumor necrosis factor ligand superfamily member 14-like n=1 Tax=Haliotis cracherodii TaxID=6455 RepID=UPI0039E78928
MNKLGLIGVTLVVANVILLVALTGVVIHRHTDRQGSRDFIPVYGTSEFIDSTLTSSTEETSRGDDESTLTWRQDMDAAFVSDKISYKDGGLTVKEGGYYYIYSQIVYSGNGSREFASGWIRHALVKQTASELEDTTRNLQSTPSIRRGRPAYTTSSLGATFYLEANTRVKVRLSVPGNIHVRAPHSNYFGMFLI